MKQLNITDIDNPTIFKDHLGQCTKIALKSISIRPSWLNLFNNNEFTIRKVGPDQKVNKIEIMRGLYKIDDLAAIIKKQAEGKTVIFVLRNGLYRLRVNDGCY